MEIRVNVSLIGDVKVGKTTIANMINKKSYSDLYQASIGASMLRIPFQIEDETISFQLWDTAGMERYRSLAPVYYRDSNFGVIVFDFSEIETFKNAASWLALYRTYTDEGNPIILIGNKLDAVNEEEKQQISAQAELWASENNATFIATSAKENVNIESILPKIYQILKDEKKLVQRNKGKRQVKQESSGCC